MFKDHLIRFEFRVCMTVGGGGGMEDKPKNVGGEGLFILIYEKRHNSVVV